MHDVAPFERGALIYPQPVAIACDRIRRARTEPEQVETILKGAEIVTRYLASLSLSSFCARTDAAFLSPSKLSSFDGGLTFGSFLNAIRNSFDVACDHPLKDLFVTHFRGKGKPTEKAEDCLSTLMDLRNRLGHNLNSLATAQAMKVLREDTPDTLLVTALQRLEPLLSLPLFFIDSQTVAAGKLIAQQVLLMGASLDPEPKSIELPFDSRGLYHLKSPYVGFEDGVLNLEPFLIWSLVEQKANFGLHFVHDIKPSQVKYHTVYDDSAVHGAKTYQMLRERIHTGSATTRYEPVSPVGSSSFAKDWQAQRRVVEQSNIGLIPWDDFDLATIRWYGKRLKAKGGDNIIQETIRERLLDGREYLTGDEIRQIVLLFGRPELVARKLGRTMIDLRAKFNPEKRWNKRIEETVNILDSLKIAVQFFTRYVPTTGRVTLEGLSRDTGKPDYVAMREALVNLFIHQDYTDQRIVSQIEITEDYARFTNAGCALVSIDDLAEGGTSQSRNPMISRALKLVNFAELGGSGIREVYRVWRTTNRRPPVFASDERNNRFQFMLDRRPMPMVYDSFWQDKIGLSLEPVAAEVVLLSSEPGGVQIETIAASQGLRLDKVRELVNFLVVNLMVKEVDGRVILDASRRALVDEAKAQEQLKKDSPPETPPADDSSS